MKTAREAALDIAVRQCLVAPLKFWQNYPPDDAEIHISAHVYCDGIRSRFDTIWNSDHAPIYRELAESAKRGLIASGHETRTRRISQLFGGFSDD